MGTGSGGKADFQSGVRVVHVLLPLRASVDIAGITIRRGPSRGVTTHDELLDTLAVQTHLQADAAAPDPECSYRAGYEDAF